MNALFATDSKGLPLISRIVRKRLPTNALSSKRFIALFAKVLHPFTKLMSSREYFNNLAYNSRNERNFDKALGSDSSELWFSSLQ